jgi:hypothetical protein
MESEKEGAQSFDKWQRKIKTMNKGTEAWDVWVADCDQWRYTL